MTLIAALHGRDGLVMAADSRGTFGDPRGLTAINDSQSKLFQLTKFVGVAIAGTAELANQLLASYLQQQHAASYVDDVLAEFRNFVRAKYQDWFERFPLENRPFVHFLIAGMTSERGNQGKIFLLGSNMDFAPQYTPQGFMLSGIPQYAIYLLHRLYSPGMSRKHLIALAAYVIAETATQDPKVGGPIRIAEIIPGEGYSAVDQDTINDVLKRNEEQNQRLRDFFFGGDNNGPGKR